MSAIKTSLCQLLAGVITLSLVTYWQLADGYWLVLSALLGLQLSNGITLSHKTVLLVMTALIAGLVVFMSSLLAPHVWLSAVFLMIVTFATVYLGLIYAGIWVATLVVNFFALLAAVLPSSVADATQRVLAILLGFFIALVLGLLFRKSAITHLKLLLATSLQELCQLNRAFFAFYLKRNYKENIFAHEKKLHTLRRNFLYTLVQARKLSQQLGVTMREPFNTLIAEIEQIYELILTLGLLVYRVDDHSTFEVGEKELSALVETISLRLLMMASNLWNKNSTEPPNIMPDNIEELEKTNQNALQVVAREPLVFVLFIQDLQALDAKLTQLSQAIEKVKAA